MKKFRSCCQPHMDFGLGDEAVDIYSPVAHTPLPLRTTRAGGEALARPLLNIDCIRHTVNHCCNHF